VGRGFVCGNPVSGRSGRCEGLSVGAGRWGKAVRRGREAVSAEEEVGFVATCLIGCASGVGVVRIGKSNLGVEKTRKYGFLLTLRKRGR
jgi:hypothetical protein